VWFLAEEGVTYGVAPGWVVGAVLVAGAFGAFLVKVWPLLIQSRESAAKTDRERQEAQAKIELERQDAQAKIDQQQKATEARIKREAYDAAMEGMTAVLKQYQQDRANDAQRISGLFDEVRKLQQNHAECLATNETLRSAFKALQSKVEGIEVSQDLQRIPTRQEALIVTDERQRILEWNQAATVLLHWTAREAVGRQIGELIPEPYQASHDAGFADCLNKHRPPRRGPYHLEAMTKEGEQIPVEMTLSGWEEPDGTRRFAASIRREVRVHGVSPMEMRAGDMRAPAAPAAPHAEAVAAERQQEAVGGPAGTIAAVPLPQGGALLKVPPGAEVTVEDDSLRVNVKETTGGPQGPKP
jgi:PAS domain S-box-containing protein